MLSIQNISKLASYRTPFYLYDVELLHRTLQCAVEQSARYGYHIHYALKANFDDRLLAVIRSYGLGVDCVSGNEVRKAVESGFDPRKVVYAGVGKNDDEIRYSIEQNILSFNCESRQELQVIDQIAAEMGRTVDVALRINPDVDPHTHKHISTGHGDSKFGISYREIEQVADEVEQLRNIRIVGLHFHVGSQILDMSVFENLCRRVNELSRWFENRGFALEHINVGGGLGIDYVDPDRAPIPDFEGYFATFARTLDIGDKQVHFELGRSIIGQCGELISRVLYRKTTPTEREVAIIDASMTELMRPALYGAHHRIVNLTSPDATMMSCMVAGTVCESSDIFARDVELPELQRGDLVSIQSAGAYGRSMASCYNLHALPDAVYSDEL